MSGGLLQYSGLITKARAMHGRLLTKEELMHLSELERVEDFIIFLRESKGYSQVYASHEEIHHRAQVEAVIYNSLYADYRKLFQFANGEQRKGLEIIFLRYEMNVLKWCMDAVSRGGNASNLSYLNLFFDRHSGFDTAAVTQAGNMQEFLNALAGTPYEKLFLRMRDNDTMTMADCAFALDIYYYTTAWQMKEKIRDGNMKRILTQILGTEIDWLNIMWMYRSKQFYKMSATDIEADTIPVRYRLKKTEYRALLQTETIDEFMEIIRKTAYVTEKNAIISLGDEITFQKVMDRTYEKTCKEYPHSIAPVLKYLDDKENEIDNLTTILEGERYQIPSKEIREMILIS